MSEEEAETTGGAGEVGTTPTPLSPLGSTRHCRLHSPTCISCPRGTSPPVLSFWFLPGGSSVPPPLPLSVDAVVSVASVTSLATPSLPRVAPLPSLDIPSVPLPPPPPSLRILRLLTPPLTPPPPRPRPPISPVKKKMSVTGQGGVRHAGQLQVGPCRAGSALAGPSPWWGGRHQPSLVLAPPPTVSSSALSASIPDLARPGGQAHGVAVIV